MKTRTLACALLLGVCSAVSAQPWDLLGNTVNNTTQYLGCNDLSNQPLRLRNYADRPIEFFVGNNLTNARWMHLSASALGQTVNGFPVDLSYYLGVGDFGGGAYQRASARLHLDNASSISIGFRDMMQDGLLSTQGEALFYSGLLGGGESGILWSYATGPSGTPRPFRFIYTGDNQTTTTAGGVDGLELARLEPDASLNEGFFGIGDWTSAGVTPDERLDVLDRTIRIRRLPADFEDLSGTMFRVVVVDNNGRLHWRPETDFTGQTDCDWKVDAGQQTVTTAWTGGTSCNSLDWKVGIGTASPGAAKLHVRHEPNTAGADQGIKVTTRGDGNGDVSGINIDVDPATTGSYSGQNAYGLAATTRNGSTNTYGVQMAATLQLGLSGSNIYGGKATADGHGTVNNAYGLHAVCSGDGVVNGYGIYGKASSGTLFRCGVYGQANSGATNSWAGYFAGNLKITGNGFVNGTVQIISDQSLKTNIQDLSNAGGLLAQLTPRTYEYMTADHPSMGLSEGLQYGLIAQEVEAVMPTLVKDVVTPAEYDTSGVEIAPQATHKSLNYIGLIPVLIGAFQEQQAQIAELQNDLAACCAATGGDVDTRNLTEGQAGMPTSLENDRLTIAPNPFQERTTLSYLLEAPARVRLQVHTEGGMHLATLRDQPQEAGSYSMTWDTQDLAPGLYYVTLFADGKPVVKKAVKVR